jgi:TonB family protein
MGSPARTHWDAPLRPRMTNAVPPFRYQASLYERKVQADVTLRLFIYEHGAVKPEYTQVVNSSGHAALDSSAVEGWRRLAFVPAKRRGEP